MIDPKANATKFRAVTRANIETLPQWRALDPDLREAVKVISRVLPFRTNRYVCDELIDWDRVPNDPIFQLTFPQRGMLDDDEFQRVRELAEEADDAEGKEALDREVERVRLKLNPHPAGQMTHNVPMLGGEAMEGMQHKYRETTLFFPSHGQTCHAYCTFCFRWAQFVGMDDMKFANKEADDLVRYVRANPRITDVLFTGGDPMVMKTKVLERYVLPLLEVESVRTIRIGTKSVAYWPQRYVSDADADDLMRLFERVAAAGKHLAIMGHYSHAVELSTPTAREAVRRIRSTGANIRMQSPVIRHVNDDAGAWVDLWRTGTQLGCIPYYMFVERDTGAKQYFDMPLVRCWNIFRNAYQQIPGTARTVRGPSMSCFPGKCHILGVADIGDQQAFVLEFLQAREPDMVRRPFFAKYDPKASWYDDLEPFGEADEPFFPQEDDDVPTVNVTVSGGDVAQSRHREIRSNN